MNRIRGSINALLSRSSRKDLRSEEEDRRHTPPASPHLGGRKNSTGSCSSTSSSGFTVIQTRVYTKGERNSYHYSPVPFLHLPTFQIDPPDDIPYQLPEEHPTAATPPPVPTLKRPVLRIDTTVGIRPSNPVIQSKPPSPPSSPSIQLKSPDGVCASPSPTRAPPSPPTTPLAAPHPPPFLSASDDILIQIFSHLDSPRTMESLALAHPRFHAVLEPNKLFILRGIIKTFSPPAAALVELLRADGEVNTARTYIETYKFSLDVVRTLKTLIQSRCRFFLTREKMDFANEGAERAFEEALYNIWCFCLLFRDHRESVERQMACLRRLGTREIMDMLEIWGCLGVLLRPLAECTEMARKYGVVESRPVTSNDNAQVILELEEWVAYVQTRGLDAMLPIVQWSETCHTQMYTIVVGKGLHRWTKQPKTPYSHFLRDPASKVYKELSLAERQANSRARRAARRGDTI